MLALGYLTFKSGFIPRWLSILLVVASLGYMTDSFGRFLSPNYTISISTYTFVGEALLILWLFWRAIKGFNKVSKTV